MRVTIPEISLIIPLLDEAPELPGLFADLAAQEGICFEIIFCDGGSTDGSGALCRALAPGPAFSVQTVSAERGRGRQMNTGAALSRSGLLLFLHADSRFENVHSLQRAVTAYRHMLETAGAPVAARFSLRFRRKEPRPSLAYHYYESKARLNRPDCIRGDQGFLLDRDFFNSLGGFDTSLPFLEDVRMASAVAEKGSWRLLPAEITTSARRFESEGLYERQVVNAIITNVVSAGWMEFFDALPGLYRCNSRSGRLQLYPLLEGIRILLAAGSGTWRSAFWRSTGRHVAANIWQLFFWLDVRESFGRNGLMADHSAHRYLWFQRNLEHLTRGWLAETVTAGAVRVWFRFMLIRHRGSTETS